MAMTFSRVFKVIAVFSTFCVCVNTFSIIQDKRQTNSKNLRIFTRHKRSGVTSNFCLDKNEIWYQNKCRTPEEFLRLKNETSDYVDITSSEILNITDSEEVIEKKETYNKSSAVIEPTKFETTHHEPTKVHSSTIFAIFQTVRQSDTTVSSKNTARISDEVHSDRKLNDRTRDYDYLLTTKIVFVTDTVKVVGDKVTYIKTSTASVPSKFETTHQETTEVHSSSVVKEFPTASQSDKTNSTSTSTTTNLDEVHNYLWILIGVLVVLSFICLLYWYYCLRRNKYSKSNSEENYENQNNAADAETCKIIEC